MRRVVAVFAAVSVSAMASSTAAQFAAAWDSFVASPDAHPNIPNVMHSGYKGGGVGFPDDAGRAVLNVLSFGAVGDGVADDTAAIRTALTIAEIQEPSQAEGVTVFFPAGTYRLTGPLLVHSDRTILRGAGRGETVLRFAESLASSYAVFDLGDGDSGWSFNGGMIWFTDPARNDYFTGVPTVSGIGDSWTFAGAQSDVAAGAVRGERVVQLQSASGFSVGDHVVVQIDNADDLSTLRHLFGDGIWANGYAFGSPRDSAILPSGRSNFRNVHTIEAISGNTVTLREPLKFDLRAEWDPVFRTPRDMRRDVGLADMTVHMDRDYEWELADHGAEPGYNAVCLSNTLDGFVKDVTILNPGGHAVQMNYSSNVSVEGVLIDATSEGMRPHHHGFKYTNTYNSVVHDFEIRTLPFHGVEFANSSIGNVYSKGVMAGGTFDYHRRLPYENVYTEISLLNNGTASGASTSGPRTGARSVHWNVTTGPTGGRIVAQPDILPMGGLVGVTCATVSRTDNAEAGESEAIVESSGIDGEAVLPANLYLAQLAIRDGSAVPHEPGMTSADCPCPSPGPYDFSFGGTDGSNLIEQDNWAFGRDFNGSTGRTVELGLELGHPDSPIFAAVSESGQDSVITRQADGVFSFRPFLHTQSDARIRFDARIGANGSGSGNANLILNNFRSYDDGLQFGMSASAFTIRAGRFGSELNESVSIPSGWYDQGEWARLELVVDFTAGPDGEASLFFENLTTGFARSAVPGLQGVPLGPEVRFPESWDRIEARIRNDAAFTNVVPNVGTLGLECSSCAGDLNGDGALDELDTLLQRDRIAMDDALADVDGDGSVTFLDFVAFLRAFDAGCD